MQLQGAAGLPPPAALPPPGPARGLPAPPAPPAAAGPGLSGARLRGQLQLHAVQQLRTLLLPHAALHQRPPAHMSTATTPKTPPKRTEVPWK